MGCQLSLVFSIFLLYFLSFILYLLLNKVLVLGKLLTIPLSDFGPFDGHFQDKLCPKFEISQSRKFELKDFEASNGIRRGFLRCLQKK